MNLKGRTAIVTGSTSGIGLGIALAQAKTDLLAEKQPSGEFATPEQVGALCVFLCSEAAAQMRGVSLPVDGGWTAQ